jgi:hypothetical protein
MFITFNYCIAILKDSLFEKETSKKCLSENPDSMRILVANSRPKIATNNISPAILSSLRVWRRRDRKPSGDPRVPTAAA